MKPGSKGWKNLMAKMYGIGASIVIIGALFKIQHWPGASVVLIGGLGIEAVRVEFVEQEDLFVKMYNSFTKIDNAAALSQLYELNHIEEMIQAELSGDVEELL